MRWAVPPTGLTVLKVSLAGRDKTSLETIAQKVEQQLLGLSLPWQAPRINGLPNFNNPQL
jgi:hypothetical protein